MSQIRLHVIVKSFTRSYDRGDADPMITCFPLSVSYSNQHAFAEVE